MNRLLPIWALVLLLHSSCTFTKAIKYNTADITDYRIFPSRDLKAPPVPFTFVSAASANAPKTITYKGKQSTVDEFMQQHGTVAFLIIRNDTLLYERYYRDYNDTSWVASFSMAKSFTSALIGAAIDDGYITSVHDPITKYIPELDKRGFEKVTLEHVLKMTSGLKFRESYWSPFGKAAKYYYGDNLRKQISKLRLKRAPGKRFQYVSGNTQLLGLVLERALKDKSVTQYLQEKIWTPLGMESYASWSTDEPETGLEKTFCCLNATARDFAKFGRLYLNKGNWNGTQVLPEWYVAESVKVDTTQGSAAYYQYQWWLPNPGDGTFCAVGILGQYIYVDPAQNLIIVRLGKNQGGVNWTKLLNQFKSVSW